MEGIDDIKTDASIANILRRLKDTTPKNPTKDDSNTSSTEHDTTEQTPESSSTHDVKEIPDAVVIRKNDQHVNDYLEDKDFTEDEILPWFSKADKDLDLLHYIKLNDYGDVEYCSIKTDRPAEIIASLKIKPDYLCDIDYYKSKHYVLYVKQIESDYAYSRLYTPESKIIVIDETQIVSDDSIVSESATTNPDLVKIPSDDLAATVTCYDKYTHYVVFTDLGVADFIARSDEATCSCCSADLNKWFEETSNYIQLKNTEYDANPRVISNEASSLKDFKYDIITMHMPGVITLDSVDNNDPDYKVHIKLKDEYSFLPMNRILGCLKNYSLSDKKGIDDFRRFINRYFDIIV